MALAFAKIDLLKRVDANRAVIRMNHKITRNGHTQTYKFDMPISLFSKNDYRNALVKNGFLIKEEISISGIRMGAFVCVKK